ncbi:hypothetical protein [Geodermatophilus sp. TF02-6]|uniref:hypothetical protein n=1 Tax=Geodermatophilus sp. TF02-6 TaxID=2250575 RepID=UPI0011BF695F|nr:hypothetical protein [Geodermatophilus sp. TF02-6]
MRVVADTHALVWYLLDDPDRRLSSAALAALEEAESTDGIAVSVASVVDLWYVIRTRGTFTDDQLDQVLGLLRDPDSPLEAEPVTLDIAAAFRQIPGTRSAIRGTASSLPRLWPSAQRRRGAAGHRRRAHPTGRPADRRLPRAVGRLPRARRDAAVHRGALLVHRL